MTRAEPAGDDEDQVVTLCFFRFATLRHRLWAFAQMGLARRPIRRLPGVGFFKLMGAGTGEGFAPLPDPGVVAVLTTWPNLAAARLQTEGAPVFRRYRARAAETFTIHLSPTSVRGAWSGRAPFRPGATRPGPVAAMTRATIRRRALLRFWCRVPRISERIGADPNVLFKAGVGEVPWLHQVTFSVWPNVAAMAAFARADGPHAAAIRSVREEGWFAEELYARFTLRAHSGSWGGRDPLARVAPTLAAE